MSFVDPTGLDYTDATWERGQIIKGSEVSIPDNFKATLQEREFNYEKQFSSSKEEIKAETKGFLLVGSIPIEKALDTVLDVAGYIVDAVKGANLVITKEEGNAVDKITDVANSILDKENIINLLSERESNIYQNNKENYTGTTNEEKLSFDDKYNGSNDNYEKMNIEEYKNKK